jgi:hypothetical protein
MERGRKKMMIKKAGSIALISCMAILPLAAGIEQKGRTHPMPETSNV